MKKILIIEDDTFIQDSLKEVLSQDYMIKQAYTYKEAILYLLEDIDLWIVDIELPDGNGIELCKELRKVKYTPLLFLTAKNNEETIVQGLNAGGDDYVCKPFSIIELNARINSLLRRVEIHQQRIQAGDLLILPDSYKVYKNDEELNLTTVSYEILFSLIKAHGKVVTREQLLSFIEDTTGHFIENNTLSVHMKRLRKKLGVYNGKTYIETIRGIGYRWNFYEKS